MNNKQVTDFIAFNEIFKKIWSRLVWLLSNITFHYPIRFFVNTFSIFFKFFFSLEKVTWQILIFLAFLKAKYRFYQQK